jgi:MYXO-CTERM domain-containing protein
LVQRDGTALLDQTFASAAAATQYFTDHSIDLGSMQSTQLDLAMEIDLTVNPVPAPLLAWEAGTVATLPPPQADADLASFDVSVLVGNATAGAGPATPEPAGFGLLLVGMTLLLRRRST